MQHETKQKLNELLAETGHALAVSDLDDVIELDRLACLIADPQTGIDAPLTNHAVYVRSVPVYPLTLAHLSFLDSTEEILGVPADERTLAMLWVVTQEEITNDHWDPDFSRKAFKKWARRSRWTEADINQVLELRFAKLTNRSPGESDDSNEGALIGLLTKEYGESPFYWMHKAPLGIIEACVADWTIRQEAQAAAYRKANKGAGPAPPPSPKFVASRRFREYADTIREKWLQESE